MNNSLSHPDRINEGLLHRGDYFVSLMEQALSVGLISEDESDGIKIQCLKLMGELAEHYTSGESSSIPEATAEKLMQSIFYTLGTALKSYRSPDSAVSALLEKGAAALYSEGRQMLSKLLIQAKRRYSTLCAVLVPVDNITYRGTILHGIKGFFKKYDAAFSAHSTIITADYPTAKDLSDLSGIEFINQYICALTIENRFLRLFKPEHINALIKALGKNGSELIISIYTLVFTQAVGCEQACRNPFTLSLDEEDINKLRKNLKGKIRTDIEKIIINLYDKSFSQLFTANNATDVYIRNTIPIIAAEIHTAVQNGAMERVFVAMCSSAIDVKNVYDFGEKMGDEKYRALLYKISECGHYTEKLALIAHNVTSLADYSDILQDVQLSDEEAYRILEILSPPDIAALCVKYGIFDAPLYEYNDREEQFKRRLKNYLINLTDVDITKIKYLSGTMEII